MARTSSASRNRPVDLDVVAEVGPRQPCPCGSGRRYKACHGKAAVRADTRRTERPFAGMVGECDWVALREIVPAATVALTLTADYAVGDAPATAVTMLPMAWPGLRHADGRVLVGLQTATSSGDASRDIAAALLMALSAEPGTPVDPGATDPQAPRLQDVLDPAAPFEVVVHEGFDFWLSAEEATDLTGEARTSLEQANASVVPTQRLSGVEAAYWCRVGEREHLRWVMPHEEEALLDALSRLRISGQDRLVDDDKLVGMFRTHGVVVPVWDVPLGTGADALEAPAARFEAALTAVLSEPRALTGDERRARAGLLSRQVTLR